MALRGAGRGSIIESYEFSQGYPRLRRGSEAALDRYYADLTIMPSSASFIADAARWDYLIVECGKHVAIIFGLKLIAAVYHMVQC